MRRKAPFVYIIVLKAFIFNSLGLLPLGQAQPISPEEGELRLPAPGIRVGLSPEFNPPILKGIKVHPDNPFRFDFILDQGDKFDRHPERSEGSQQEQLKQQATCLIKYFLASLTIPEKDLWVNLSPYEKDRIIPRSFGLTEMGRDLLAEDYMLKQITASLIYPEDQIGKKFWKRVYEEAARKFGTTNIPVNTFNKVWIIPEKAVVYENAKAGTAYVVESKLKVMLEEDYLSLTKHSVSQKDNVILSPRLKHSGVNSAKDLIKINSLKDSSASPQNDVSALGSQIVREIVIPELTKEVNEDKNFAQLRQVYNSLILATWYKKKIKDSILSQVYADKNKIAGVQYLSSVIPAQAGIHRQPKARAPRACPGGNHFKNDVEGLYQEYLDAFKKGVYNYIKEEQDPITQEPIPRKYFSGGVTAMNISQAMTTVHVIDRAQLGAKSLEQVRVNFTVSVQTEDHAMRSIFRKEMEDLNYFLGDVKTKLQLWAAVFLTRYVRHARRVGGVPTIIVSGPSGTGKSDLSENVKALLEKTGFRVEHLKLDMFMIERPKRYHIINGIHDGTLDPDKLDESTFFDNGRIKRELLDPLMAFKKSGKRKKVFNFKNVNIPEKKQVGDIRPISITDKTVVIIEGKYAHMPELMDHYEKNSFHVVIRSDPGVEREQFRAREEKYRTPEELKVLMDVHDRFFVPSYEHYVKKIPGGVWSLTISDSDEQFEDIESYYRRITGDSAQLAQKKSEGQEDRAMIKNNGGIDLTPANMNLQTKMDSRFPADMKARVDRRGNDSGVNIRNDSGGNIGNDSEGIKFHLDPAQIAQLQNAPGFVPVIISVKPLRDLQGFLGVQNDNVPQAVTPA